MKIKAYALYCKKEKKILRLENHILESDCSFAIYDNKDSLEQPPKKCDKWVEVEIIIK